MVEIQTRITFDQNRDGVVSEDEAKYFLSSTGEMDWQEFHESGYSNMKPYFLMESGLYEPPEASKDDVSMDTISGDDLDHSEEVVTESGLPEVSEDAGKGEDDDQYDDDSDDVDKEEEDEEEETEGEVDETKNEEEKEPPKYDEETQRLIDEANRARSEAEEADRNVRDLLRETRQIQDSLDRDYGLDEEFAVLDGQCFEYTDREYTYRLKSFSDTDQSSSSWYSPVDGREETNSSVVAPNRSTSSEDEVCEIILSVFWRSGKLGAAYYSLENSEIHILPDVVDISPEFTLLKCLYNQIKPSQVVTNSRASRKFITCLKTLLNFSSSLVHDEQETNYLDSYHARKLFCLPGKDFYFEPCKRRVLSLQLPGEVRRISDEERFNYLHSIIDMTAETMVQALGALLLYLDRSWAELTLQPGSHTPPILAINAVSLENMVTIDSVSYEALQIFSQKSHPSNFKKWAPGSNKEGLSVYGIFNRCKSQLGCNRLREIFLHPCRDLNTLKQRQDVIDFCIKGRNIGVVKNFLDYLKHITSVTKIMTKLAVTQASVKEWKSLYKTIYNCILIGELCSGYTEEAEIFQKINDHGTEDLQKIAHYIFRVMDFEQSEAQNKFVVRMGVDEELDKLKQKHLGLSTFMSKVAEEELENLPPEVKECSLMYLPEIGYILCLPTWKDNMEDSDFDIPGLEFKFKANRMAHYKSERCKELDSALGDCSVQVMAYELKIMVKLIEFILEHLSPVVKIVNLAAQLDCLISLAIVARENGYVRPELIRDERVIEIQGGRHPLQELCMESFVPNDTYLGQKEGLGCMKILTGPNASGKSVYLKQVALITFLAHIGSFVPAISAKIGIIDSIFTRIRTTESVSIQLSAFMIDLCQISSAVNCSSPLSLVIIDEFGKGTSELDGLSLLTATLQHFLSRSSNCPFVLVSTHFHNITQILPPSPGFDFQTLDHIFEENQIIYLYKLKNGCVKSSFAHQVAESIGIDEKIISRSKQTLVALEEVKPLRGASVEKTRNMFQQNVRILEDLRKENFVVHTAEELLLKQRDLLKHL